MKEELRQIQGYEGLYEVSNLGRVKSLERYDKIGRLIKEKILTPRKDKKGYLYVGLSKDGVQRKFSIHRLVAIAFIPNPDNLPQVNHKDENKEHNWEDNLEWCTNIYNCNYGNHGKNISKALLGGTLSEQTRQRMSETRSIKIVQLSLDGKLVKIWNSLRETDKFGYKHACISECCRGLRKTHKKFRWMYYEEYININGGM